MPERRELAKIHIAKQELGLEDECYRALLRRRYGVDSAADLSQEEALDLLRRFRTRGWRPRPAQGPRRGASLAQRRLIRSLWDELGRTGALHLPGEEGLLRFVAHRTGCRSLRDLRVKEASALIQGLKQWLERERDRLAGQG